MLSVDECCEEYIGVGINREGVGRVVVLDRVVRDSVFWKRVEGSNGVGFGIWGRII